MHTLTNPDHILYVDDEEALLEIGRIFLERAGGITVAITSSPREACEMIVTGRYDAVVSDYMMPGMDGIALLKQIRKGGSRVPFIIFTGRGREEVVIEALNNGADFYLQKGGDPKMQFAELANAVRQLAGRRRAEAAFRKSEEMLHKAESLAHLGSWEFDHRTGRLAWSDETYRIFGLDPAEPTPTYEAFLSMVHPDDRTSFDTTYFTSIADGKDTYEIEHRILRGDTGELRYLVERCEHQRDESGRSVRSVGMVHDITDRKLDELELMCGHEELQAAYEQLASVEEELRTSFDDLAENQQRLRESERRLADIIDFLPDATFVIDTGGRVIAWNRAIEEITGVPAAELLGRGDYAYAVPFYGEARPGLIDYVLRPDGEAGRPYRLVERKGEILEGEATLAHPGGRDAVLRLRASPLYDREGRLVGSIETIRSITEQRRVEETLRETAEKMESIFRAAPTGIGMAVDGVFTEVNGRLCDITGYTREELIGRPLRLLFSGDAAYASALQEMHAQIQKIGTCTLETRCMRKDGAIIDVLLSGTPLDPMDFSRGMTFTVLDVSERVAMEREIAYHAGELVRQTNSLAVANRKLNLMSSITRHDILNQLTILLGNLWFAQEAGPDQNISEYLARVQSAADRIRRQIEFTRDYTDLGVRSPEWQRVSDAIREEPLHGLPVDDDAGNLVIYADPMLATVFSNLMDNTIRHGESATRVHVRYRPEENGDLTLIWEDDGAGVPAEEKERIFHRGVGKNTGLGLFLIREILGITGIRITEMGEPGNGARFEMLVPRGVYRV
ncbi:MAG: PAS domain S-box protein [Massilibacteroides sp.]|nr:PAS domain S-box protein [Massilibacteroides sp.]